MHAAGYGVKMQNLYRTDGWVKSTLGPAIPGAQVWLCSQPANIAATPPSPLVPIFSDPGGLFPITQPIMTDGFGHYDFYTLPGLYTLVVAYGGQIQQVYPDQSIGGVGTGSSSGTALVLQTNGTPNVNQLLQNLTGAGSVSVFDNGNGTISITGSVFQVQTNGVPNTLQSLLNLKSGLNITLTPDAFGGVTVQASGTSLVLFENDCQNLTGWTTSGIISGGNTNGGYLETVLCNTAAYAYINTGIVSFAGCRIELDMYGGVGGSNGYLLFGCNASGAGPFFSFSPGTYGNSGFGNSIGWSYVGTAPGVATGGSGSQPQSTDWYHVIINVSKDGTFATFSANGANIAAQGSIVLEGSYIGLSAYSVSASFANIRIYPA